MDNKSAFNVNGYDENVRKVIPFYDEIYNQVVSLIKTRFENNPLSILDTGCGTGTFGLKAFNSLDISELILCDPSENMLNEAKKKLEVYPCEFILTGSEDLDFKNRFDLVVAIQSHHYFNKPAREKAVKNCYNALKSGGMFMCFENTAPFSETGKEIMLKRLETFELEAGRSAEEVKSHSARYNKEFFPITLKEHFELLNKTGFKVSELFWHSYMQSGFYAIK
ncbi:MAG: class I SAM-dependent methyltransferase [Ruminococcus sp.]|nr:class I SAM-dependent methyltransferase [Ruminococcus sp.]